MLTLLLAPIVVAAPPRIQDALRPALTLIAEGKLMEAEPILRKLAQESTGKSFGAASEPVPAELTRLRVQFSLDSGEAAAWNNLGALLLLLGRYQEATEALDKAAGLQPEWGVPWANSALVWLAKRQPGKADEVGRIALVYGARTANLYATLAEANLARRNTRQAEEYIRRALDLEPGHGYAIFVKNQLHEQQGKLAEAERDLLQALAQNSFVANGFQFAPVKVTPGVAGGGRENWQLLTGLGFKNGMGGSFQALRDVGSVEGQAGVDQRLTQARLVLGKTQLRGDSVVTLAYREQSDTRALSPTLQGRTGLTRTDLNVLQSVRFSPSSQLRVLGRWRQSEVTIRSQASGSRYSPALDKQLSGEAQWLRQLTPSLGLQVGGAWLQNTRTEEAPAGGSDLSLLGGQLPVQPLEQVFLPGVTNLWTAHALLRYPILGRTLTLGPVFGSQAGAPGQLFTGKKVTRAVGVDKPAYSGTFLPYLDWARPLPTGQTFRLSVVPQVGPTGTALAPGETSRVLQPEGALPSLDATGNRLGARSLYYGSNGQGVSYEAGVGHEPSKGLSWATTLFHRELRNVGSASGDPRLDPSLRLAPWTRTRATGLQAGAGLGLPGGLRLGGFVRYQEARGTLVTDLRTDRAVANAPRWQGNLNLSWNASERLHLGVQTLAEGARTVTAASVGATASTYTQVALPSLRRYALTGGVRLRDEQELSFSLVVPDKSYWQGGKPETVVLLGLGARR